MSNMTQPKHRTLQVRTDTPSRHPLTGDPKHRAVETLVSLVGVDRDGRAVATFQHQTEALRWLDWANRQFIADAPHTVKRVEVVL